jgi:hypothetical protein
MEAADMSEKQARAEREHRPNVVGVRFSNTELDRMVKAAGTLAFPITIPLSSLAHSFTMIGVRVFERQQQRKQQRKNSTQ